jgi:hypothetical protein
MLNLAAFEVYLLVMFNLMIWKLRGAMDVSGYLKY